MVAQQFKRQNPQTQAGSISNVYLFVFKFKGGRAEELMVQKSQVRVKLGETAEAEILSSRLFLGLFHRSPSVQLTWLQMNNLRIQVFSNNQTLVSSKVSDRFMPSGSDMGHSHVSMLITNVPFLLA